ncbi:unnamed protein product [Effrenium voratum]|nr:unnamed protein product [Effrenium voratum]
MKGRPNHQSQFTRPISNPNASDLENDPRSRKPRPSFGPRSPSLRVSESRPFPACETLAFARLLREDAELQSAVAEVWRDLRLWGPDVLVTAGFPVLPKEVVTIPKIALNFHPADLPRYRGGLPLQALGSL